MIDAIVVGAGPAGSVAALQMARAGARVLVVDRADVPHGTLCGGVLCPQSLQQIEQLGLGPLPGAPIALRGWRVSAPCAGVPVEAAVRPGRPWMVVRRGVFDAWLLQAAVAAGARFEPGWRVQRPLVDRSSALVRGVVMRRRNTGGEVRLPAHMVIAADGRRSTLSRQVGLQMPARARRGAGGLCVSAMSDEADLGEIHLGAQAYAVVSPLGGGAANLWMVGPAVPGRNTDAVMRQLLSHHADLARRVASSVVTTPARSSVVPVTTTRAAGVAGLLLAGDAAGGVEPLGRDGIWMAMLGGQLAAEAALVAIETGAFASAVDRLGEARRRHLGRSIRAARARQVLLRRPLHVAVVGLASRLRPEVLADLALGPREMF